MNGMFENEMELDEKNCICGTTLTYVIHSSGRSFIAVGRSSVAGRPPKFKGSLGRGVHHNTHVRWPKLTRTLD
jgi:hypothetical protein